MKEELHVAVGLADLCEIAGAALAFPTEELTRALADGSFAADLEACFEDAARGDASARCVEALARFKGADTTELSSLLRKGYSMLYLAPGAECPVWPYESAFRFVSEGREGAPSLFRSPFQLDVERHMREAGVLPKDARTEPADSVWNELSFISYLYGNVAKVLHEDRVTDAVEWSARVVRFWDEHASKWLPDFMRKTIEEAPRLSYGAEYAALAGVGLAIIGVIDGDVESRKGA